MALWCRLGAYREIPKVPGPSFKMLRIEWRGSRAAFRAGNDEDSAIGVTKNAVVGAWASLFAGEETRGGARLSAYRRGLEDALKNGVKTIHPAAP